MTTANTTARDGFVRGHRPANSFARRSLIILLTLGLVAVAVLVQFGENGIFSLTRLQTREAQLRQEVAGLEAENTRLAEQVEAIATDPAALEKLAREKHNMRRPDEAVLYVSPAPTGD